MASVLESYVDVVNEVLNFGFNDGPQVNRKRIERWVNEAQFQIAREVEGSEFQETQVINMIQGTYRYALPEGFLRTQDIYYPFLSTRLRIFDIQDFDMINNEVQGPPALYTLYQQELWLFPTPNSNEELRHRYLKRPPQLIAEADIPTLNKDYLHLLVGYAVTRAFEAEDDLEAATAHKTRYKEDLDAYATDVQWRIVDRPRVINGTWAGGSNVTRGVI
jgi:hypothetical protein